MLNHDYLDRLDTLLDKVDETINDMHLEADTKKDLVSLIYKLYADTEKAVMDHEYV